MNTSEMVAAVRAAESPGLWVALGHDRALSFHVATDGDGYLYVWNLDLRAHQKIGWIPFESRALSLPVLEAALETVTRPDDYSYDDYDWTGPEVLSLPDFPFERDPEHARGNASQSPRPEVSSTDGAVVYVLECRGRYKIGTTRHSAHARIRDLQTGNPDRIELVGVFPGDARLEDWLHQRFARRRGIGEWFDLDADLAEAGSWEALLGIDGFSGADQSSLFDL